MPHQFGFFLSTVFTSGSRDISMYGPVPLASRAVIMSSFCVKFCGFVALVLLAPRLRLMMLIVAMCSSSIGLGPLVTNSTVRSSIFFGMPAALA